VAVRLILESVRTEARTASRVNRRLGFTFIAASYNPFANDGDGQCDISVGYDVDSPDTPTAAATSATPVTIHARLEYCTVEMTSDPTATIRSRVRWKPEFPDPLTNRVRLRRYTKYQHIASAAALVPGGRGDV